MWRCMYADTTKHVTFCIVEVQMIASYPAILVGFQN